MHKISTQGNNQSLGIQSYSQLLIGVSNHLLSKVFRFHYHSQKVIGSLGNEDVPCFQTNSFRPWARLQIWFESWISWSWRRFICYKDSFKERQPRPPPKRKKKHLLPSNTINPQSALTFRSSQPSASFLSVFCLTESGNHFFPGHPTACRILWLKNSVNGW